MEKVSVLPHSIGKNLSLDQPKVKEKGLHKCVNTKNIVQWLQQIMQFDTIMFYQKWLIPAFFLLMSFVALFYDTERLYLFGHQYRYCKLAKSTFLVMSMLQSIS